MAADWGVVIAIIISIGAAILSWRKAPHDNRAADGGAAEAFERAASSMAERNIELMKRITDFECEIKRLGSQLTIELERSRKLEDWAIRLVHQVQTYPDGIPVKIVQDYKAPDMK